MSSLFRSLCGIAAGFALSSGAGFAQELPLGDVPPPKPVVKKKALKKKKLEPPAAANSSGVETGGALIAAPPSATAPLPDVPILSLSTRIGVTFVRSPLLDDVTSAEIESGLRGIAFQAPLSQNPIVLPPAPGAACSADDDRCFLSRAGHEGLDSVVIGWAEKSPDGIKLRVRQVAIFGQKRLGEAEGDSPDERLALKAEAEALSCKILLPTGCTAELALDVGSAEILYEGRPLPKGNSVPMRVTLPIGLARLSAREGLQSGPERLVPVTREKIVGIAMTVHNQGGVPVLMTPAELERPPAPVEAIVAEGPGGRSHWNRPVGYVVAGAGAAVALAGLVEGAHAKSLQNSASAAFTANGGAWKSGDLANLSSANSAAHTANLLLLGGAIAAVLGLTLALTF